MIEQKEYDFLEKLTSMDDKVKISDKIYDKSSKKLIELLIFIGVGDKKRYKDFSSDLRFYLEENIIVFFKIGIVKEIRKEFGKGDDMKPIPDEFYEFLSENEFYDTLFDRFIENIPEFFAELLKGNKKLNENFSLYFKYILNDILATYTLLSTNRRLGNMTSDEMNLIYNVLQIVSENFKRKLYKSGLTKDDNDELASETFTRTMETIDNYYRPIQVVEDDLTELEREQLERELNYEGRVHEILDEL
jgi:hypothetical protein